MPAAQMSLLFLRLPLAHSSAAMSPIRLRMLGIGCSLTHALAESPRGVRARSKHTFGRRGDLRCDEPMLGYHSSATGPTAARSITQHHHTAQSVLLMKLLSMDLMNGCWQRSLESPLTDKPALELQGALPAQ